MPKTILKLKSTKGTGAKRPASAASVKEYGLTIRHNPTYKGLTNIRYTDQEKRDLYNQIIGKMEARGLSIDNVYYEIKGGLHLHCRARHRKSIYFKKWQYFPYSCKFVKMYDPKGWNDYSTKEKERASFQETLNQFSEYAFSE